MLFGTELSNLMELLNFVLELQAKKLILFVMIGKSFNIDAEHPAVLSKQQLIEALERVLYSEKHFPSAVTVSMVQALKSVDWKNYSLNMKGIEVKSVFVMLGLKRRKNKFSELLIVKGALGMALSELKEEWIVGIAISKSAAGVCAHNKKIKKLYRTAKTKY